jgi:hypothetical protein
MYAVIRKNMPFVPRGFAMTLASLWYALLLALAIFGVFQPQAEFTYLAM